MNKHWLKLAVLLIAVFAANALAQAAPDGAITLKRLHPPYQEKDRIFAYRLSPDQETVVYQYISGQTNASNLYAVARRGTGAPIKLNLPGQTIYKPFAITADSQSLIYNTGKGLSKVSLIGGDVHTITLPLSPTHTISDFWLTPDGQSLVYQISQYPLVNEKLLVMQADGGAPTELASSATRIHVDGVTDQWAVYETARDAQAPLVWGMFSASLSAGTAFSLTASLPAAYGTQLAQISPDGQTAIVGVKDTSVGTDGPNVALYEAALDGSSLVRLSAADHTKPSSSSLQSPDGQRIMYVNDGGFFDSHLYSVPRGGGPAVRLDGPTVQHIGPMKITADSQYVVFEGTVPAGNSSRHRIFRAPIAGGPAEAITPEYDGSTYEIILAQNDQTVVYAPFRTSATTHVYTVPISGGQPTRLSGFLGDGARLFPLQPVGDGNTVVALQDGSGFDTAYAFDLRTGTIRDLTPPPLRLTFGVRGWTLTDSGDVIWLARESGSPATNELFVTIRDDADQTQRVFLPLLQR